MAVRIEIRPSTVAFEAVLTRIEARLAAANANLARLASATSGLGPGRLTINTGASATAALPVQDLHRVSQQAGAMRRANIETLLDRPRLPGPVAPPGDGPPIVIRPDQARYHDSYNLRSAGTPGSHRARIDTGQGAPFVQPPAPTVPGITTPPRPMTINTMPVARPTAFTAPANHVNLLPRFGKGTARASGAESALANKPLTMRPGAFVSAAVVTAGMLAVAKTGSDERQAYLQHMLEHGTLPDPDHGPKFMVAALKSGVESVAEKIRGGLAAGFEVLTGIASAMNAAIHEPLLGHTKSDYHGAAVRMAFEEANREVRDTLLPKQAHERRMQKWREEEDRFEAEATALRLQNAARDDAAGSIADHMTRGMWGGAETQQLRAMTEEYFKQYLKNGRVEGTSAAPLDDGIARMAGRSG
ncbi:MAG: hypothetical protein KF696_04545 [Planctomycetes bacterium]|nr:hypothetical protein [Planctomycetota bacterium]MCW8134242.1 hypothetical protein [Planctomycetota bacterium]